jgi:hypothetical protein
MIGHLGRATDLDPTEEVAAFLARQELFRGLSNNAAMRMYIAISDA